MALPDIQVTALRWNEGDTAALKVSSPRLATAVLGLLLVVPASCQLLAVLGVLLGSFAALLLWLPQLAECIFWGRCRV